MSALWDRLQQLVQPRDDAETYEPLASGEDNGEQDEDTQARVTRTRFSRLDYSIYVLVGIAMLWAFNMFLAAGPYLQRRFKDNQRIVDNFQSTELAVSTIANLGSMLLLTRFQAKADYPKRVVASLILYIVTFTILAMSARTFLNVGAAGYFAFIVCMVFITSLATGVFQNGAFAFVAGSGREEYMQGIMAGQGIAGVLPPIVQIISVLSVADQHAMVHREQPHAPQQSSKSAFAYFLTATAVSVLTLVAFLLLLSRHNARLRRAHTPSRQTTAESTAPKRKHIPLFPLFLKLVYFASAVFLTFVITMFFPVFTQKIISVRSSSPDASRWSRPEVFIPLSFFFWNLGDLGGRILPAYPALSLTAYPRTLLILAVLRSLFIPAYYLCNINGAGAAVNNDVFYWLLQLTFGLSNGYVGSSCMMGFGEWVEEEEREAAGGLMSLLLVAGLSVGSFASFGVAN